MFRRFHHQEPMSLGEIADLQKFLENAYKPVIQDLIAYHPTMMVGTAGTFEVLNDCLGTLPPHSALPEINPLEAHAWIQTIITQDRSQREANPFIPVERADMIVVGLLLIDFLLQAYPFQKITYTSAALKEGLLASLFGETTL